MTKGRIKSTAIGIARATKDAPAKASGAVKDMRGPSPNPMTNLVIADIAMRGGGRLLRHAIESTLLGVKYAPDKARNIVKGRSMVQTLFGTAIARVATKSVPGALLVGGGLLAKTLYDRRKTKARAEAEGELEIAKQADRS